MSRDVKEKTPFILATGDTKILEYVSSSVRTKFQSGNLAEIASVAAQRNKPLKDEEATLDLTNDKGKKVQ